MSRSLPIVALVVGLAGAAYVMAYAGVAETWAAVLASGWAVAAVVVIRAVVVAIAAMGWWRLYPQAERPSLGTCIGVRFIREGINTLLPFTAVGGDVIGARVMMLCGQANAVAAAGMMADLFAQVAAQAVYTLAGLAIFISLSADGAIVAAASAGMAIAVPALVAFYLIQRRGAGDLLIRALRRFAGDRAWTALAATDALYRALEAIHGDRRAIAESTALHLASWVLGTLEVYVALWLMGYPVGLGAALVIESLTQALRGAAFAVPGAVGVQEGGLVVLCAAFGVPAGAAIALSLVKRAADLAVGLPGLAGWQVIEGRRALAKSPEPPPAKT